MFLSSSSVGGGEILNITTKSKSTNPYIDWNAVKQFGSINLVVGMIVILLVAIAIMILFRVYKIKNLFKLGALSRELEYLKAMRQSDDIILRTNNLLRGLTGFIEGGTFKCNKNEKDFMDYNLKRANWTVPGGYRPLILEEFNAILWCIRFIVIIIGVIVFLFLSQIIGLLIVIVGISFLTIFPKPTLRMIVRAKNDTIKAHFFDMYCKLHYSLMAGGVTPISKLLTIYGKTTDNVEMLRFVDNCNNIIDTFNEYGATKIIADEYREIAEVGKLMRLIKQQSDGADVREELTGFRQELIEQEKYRLTVSVDKDIAKVRRTFILVVVLLVQAVLSAMSIYMPDLSLFSGIF